jgi:hypothetical protein
MNEPVESKRHREISVNLRQIASENASRWVAVDRMTRVVSALLMPLALVLAGFAVNSRLQDQTAKREYVTLSVSLLQETDQKKVTPLLRQWAAQLVAENSPTKLPPGLLAELQTGSTSLPRSTTVVPVSVATTMSPSSIHIGGTARLSWSSVDATTILITPNVGLVGPSGSIDVLPKETTTYTVTGTNSTGGFGTASATVVVTGVPGGKTP